MIELKTDGSNLKVPEGQSIVSVLDKKHRFLAAKINGEVKDLCVEPQAGDVVELVTRESQDGLEILRHSTAHLMAEAVQELFPGTKVTIGPVIEDGFFYDFDYERAFTDDDLAKIEKKMRQLSKRSEPIVRKEVDKAEALKIFEKLGESYKIDIINDLGEPTYSIYSQGKWFDLCRGPHMPRTGELKHFKLLKVAGAYWRGDENNKMLTRIYGTAFYSKEDLDGYLERLKEAEKRDHRRLGKELDLFSVSPDIGPGMILWHPKGARTRLLIEDFWRQTHLDRGYDVVYSPHIARAKLWEISGHTGFYEEHMYPRMDVEGQDYLAKPMNCPFHVQIFKSSLRSYRDLPLRWAELGTVYRYERSGVLHGLMRVRGFTQDDAHLFMTPDQLHEEIVGVIDLTLFMLRKFGFEDYEVFLSTRPEKYVGSVENWELATKALESALKETGLAYEVDPGEGVFYGPKIDIKIKDSLKRMWQCSTIQVDFNLPERFGLEYVASDGAKKQPIMVHRALLGSLERFFGVLVEHYGGAFPLWLAPLQVRVITVSDGQLEYADKVCGMLRGNGFRAEVDRRKDKLGYKIRSAQGEKIPVMAIIGDKEVESGNVSYRLKDGTEKNGVSQEEFIRMLKESL